MRKLFLLGGLCLTLSACTVAEPRATLPPPLPEKVTAVPYNQLLTRARSQATRATEALFVDNFADVEEAARGLEQTAQYLVKAEDVPAKHKDTLATVSGDLGKLAKELRENASAKNAEKANAVLAKINARVRSMRLSE